MQSIRVHSSHCNECTRMLSSLWLQAEPEIQYKRRATRLLHAVLAQAGARRKVDLVSARAKAFDTGAVQDA